MSQMTLSAKLLAIQGELKSIAKEKVGGHFKNKYFDVNMVIEAIKPILQKHKIIILQPLTSVDGRLAIETIIIDADTGETMKFTAPLPHTEDPQKAGAAITYFRRYALTSLLLIEGEEDNDLQGGLSEDTFDNITTTPTKHCLDCGKVITGNFKKCYTCNKK